MPVDEPRAMAAAAVVDGKIYVFGGLTGTDPLPRTVLRYDPQADAWLKLGDIPTSRARLTAAAVDGAVYVIGGYNNDPDYGWLNVVERFDPSTNQWSTVFPMVEKKGETSAATVGDMIYVFGGLSSFSGPPRDDADALDPDFVPLRTFLPLTDLTLTE
jgi:N-acetylneuraminic acid mutarotase